ncbi:transcriptional regulator [Actinobacillus porcitonsillarum]|uniref:Transcriptional regulator n=1 Tax=Actinobacillus porcitonsillarum TaxID=189834 RepID=A0A2U8FKB0_9PAST|nr:ogr/Delta-like zinc finger family protein [Actinobacillus porcitonsillarum]AWI51402.1 transcriptional regulator [Actinobacillus porcitonsillarum]
MAKILDIYCDCGSKAVVTKTERMHSNLKKLYCTCKNPDCGHKFVMNLEFSHTTTSSKLTKDGLIKYLLGKLSNADKNELLKIIGSDNPNLA